MTTADGDEDPVKAALSLLDPDVWTISSTRGMITVVRRWSDDSTDTIVILSTATSYARRDDCRQRLVWSTQGRVGDTVRAVLDLPAPGRPYP